ncbi:concanavalin A-like lectin/glucanase [Metschnikowia bicuspidata var. bicuspidata NRRL YB-4993]|uniref:Concanavalin A-like lectin/glucanase n=1 Tax=Metschnikowia bicuspidata var. bicuspidata NRRL YB-4993 TaxID=869754 RepID=A0A1A0HCR5_9ASCO|nr:concanavalin A-like lectin/glucanase [Metschnikowia bicuspidata var. bicuspidata NRRL YB-4993]OBA21780.1 concanavalin A-like lectin/glucanase [Metschnikowia bicuspidata var. bicuspidata NRRL YB-4993]
MIVLGQLIKLVVSIAPVLAILPEARLVNNEQDTDFPSRHSLPNLLKVDQISDIYADWDVRGSMNLEAGRLVVEDGKGSVWSRHPLANSKNEWTVELVFRNSEQEDVDDHSFFETNGLSFWLLDGLVPDDTLNFGGPLKFDGLQFLMNNLDYRGLKIFANDGSKSINNAETNALGGCRFNYLDSMVPFTMRVSYSASRNWFKVQIDNNLCFSTDALSFGKIGSDLRLGVSASTNPVSREYWEVLKMDIYDRLSEDAIDDHGVADGPAPKIVTKTQMSSSQRTSKPLQKAPSLMEKMMSNRGQTAPPVQNLDKLEGSLSEITSKLMTIEHTVNSFDFTKINDLSVAIEGIKQIQSQQLSVLGELMTTHKHFESLLTSHYREMTKAVRVLNQGIIEEVRKHRLEVQDVSGKVDLLMDNHREIKGQYQNLDTRSADFEYLGTIIRWVLIPLIIGIVAIIVVVYRLKKDIKHSKWL